MLTIAAAAPNLDSLIWRATVRVTIAGNNDEFIRSPRSCIADGTYILVYSNVCLSIQLQVEDKPLQ